MKKTLLATLIATNIFSFAMASDNQNSDSLYKLKDFEGNNFIDHEYGQGVISGNGKFIVAKVNSKINVFDISNGIRKIKYLDTVLANTMPVGISADGRYVLIHAHIDERDASNSYLFDLKENKKILIPDYDFHVTGITEDKDELLINLAIDEKSIDGEKSLDKEFKTYKYNGEVLTELKTDSEKIVVSDIARYNNTISVGLKEIEHNKYIPVLFKRTGDTFKVDKELNIDIDINNYGLAPIIDGNGKVIVVSESSSDDSTAINLDTDKKYTLASTDYIDINKDGTTIVGTTNGDIEETGNLGLAVVWRFDKKQDKYYHQTLPSLDSIASDPTSISDDGKIIAGTVYQRQSSIPVLWVLGDEDNITTIDVNKSRQSMAMALSKELNAVLSKSSHFNRLLSTCHADKEGMCYDISSDWRFNGKAKQGDLNVRLGYTWDNGITFGLNLNNTLYQRLPTEIKTDRGIGVGAFARYQSTFEKGNWYVESAFGQDVTKLHITRHADIGVEGNSGKTKLRGKAFKFTFGQEFNMDDSKTVGWYASLNHKKLKLNSYTETGVELPVSYNGITYKDTSLAVGLNLKKQFTNNVSGLVNVELEKSISNKDIIASAQNSFLNGVSTSKKVNSLRYKLETGVNYAFNNMFNVRVMPYVAKNQFSGRDYGAVLGFSGTF